MLLPTRAPNANLLCPSVWEPRV